MVGRFETMAETEQITVEDKDGVSVVRFTSNKILDEIVVQKFGEELLHLIEVEGSKKLVLNFEGVEFLSSAALGHLIKVEKRAKASEAKMALCNIRDSIYEVFAITRLDSVFNIKPGLDDAMAEVG